MAKGQPPPIPEGGPVVGIGASIFLIAVGAILAFAVELDIAGFDLDVVGWILMLAGVLGLVTTVLIWGRRRTVVSTEPAAYRDPATGPTEYRRVEEHREVGPPL
jgi:hypothetical protein